MSYGTLEHFGPIHDLLIYSKSNKSSHISSQPQGLASVESGRGFYEGCIRITSDNQRNIDYIRFPLGNKEIADRFVKMYEKISEREGKKLVHQSDPVASSRHNKEDKFPPNFITLDPEESEKYYQQVSAAMKQTQQAASNARNSQGSLTNHPSVAQIPTHPQQQILHQASISQQQHQSITPQQIPSQCIPIQQSIPQQHPVPSQTHQSQSSIQHQLHSQIQQYSRFNLAAQARPAQPTASQPLSAQLGHQNQPALQSQLSTQHQPNIGRFPTNAQASALNASSTLANIGGIGSITNVPSQTMHQSTQISMANTILSQLNSQHMSQNSPNPTLHSSNTISLSSTLNQDALRNLLRNTTP